MRRLGRLVLVAGAVGVAWLLFGEGPKDVVLVYDVGPAPGSGALEVELRRDGELVRRAEFRLPPPDDRTIRHQLRLPEGEYALGWRLASPAGSSAGERTLVVAEPGTIVLAIGR